MKRNYYILLIFISFGFTYEENITVKHHIKMYHMYIPDRDLRAKDRLMKQEEKQILALYSKGENNTYRMVINKNEVNEDIFTLEHFISTTQTDMKEVARHYQAYNKELFIIYHNQNGFFPILGNEYYIVNESKAKIYEIIADGNIHPFKEPKEDKFNKITDILCKYKHKVYTIPHDMCQ